MALTVNGSHKATVTELAQPHRFDWVVNCDGNPTCGWQAHVHNAHSSRGPAEADAVTTAIDHLMRKHGYNQEQAQKLVTVTKLATPETAKPSPTPTPAAEKPSTSAKPAAGK